MPHLHVLRPAIAAATLALAGAEQGVAAPVFDISVSDMNAADWQQVVTAHQGLGSVVFATRTLLASPSDTFWQTTFSLPSLPAPRNTSDVVANLYLPQTWNPALQGAIDRLDVVLDLRGLSSGFANPIAGFVRPVVEQGGLIFSVLGSDATVSVGASFDPFGFSLEDSADWRAADGSAARPDFSAQGAPLHFGYRVALGSTCTGSGTCAFVSTAVGVDNFRVDVVAAVAPHRVPEPGLPALLLAGLAAGWGARRRRPR